MQPLQSKMSSCKRQKYYARRGGTKQPERSHYNAICGDMSCKTQLRATEPETAAPKPKTRFWRTLENHQRQNEENLLTNRYRSVDAATPIRFTMSSCKRQWYSAGSRGVKQPWCSHYNAIWQRAAKHKYAYAQQSQKLQLQNRPSTP